ncbi:LytR C-terminal domain-containing protein [Patescibacteria group bacterium]|nr:LytR C-terminal domain-containing protein [Patescibacteria group bacterium]MBU1868530.1 LytR C-terminal domain-containing protein [Patescibacteria group bacterium]
MLPWKRYQERAKGKKILQKASFVVGALIFLCVIVLGIRTVQWFGYPINDSSGGFTFPDMDIGRQVNILIVGRDQDLKELNWLIVGALDKGEETLKVLEVPLELEVSTQSGDYKARNLISVGSALNPPQPISFLVNSVQNYLAIPLDAYVVVYGELPAEPDLAEILADYHRSWQSPFFWLEMVKQVRGLETNVQTNLSRYQLWRLLLESRKLREDKLMVKSLTNCLDVNNLETRDQMTRQVFAEAELERENVKVRVRNGTETPGLAAFATRFVENLGASVLVVDNFERRDVQVSEVITYKQLKPSRTLERLKGIFRVSEIHSQVDQSSPRVDVDVILGQDCQFPVTLVE